MFLHVCSLLSMGPRPSRAARPAGRTAGLMRSTTMVLLVEQSAWEGCRKRGSLQMGLGLVAGAPWPCKALFPEWGRGRTVTGNRIDSLLSSVTDTLSRAVRRGRTEDAGAMCTAQHTRPSGPSPLTKGERVISPLPAQGEFLLFLMGTQTTPGKKTSVFFALPIML